MPILTPSALYLLEQNLLPLEHRQALKVRCLCEIAKLDIEEAIMDANTLLVKEGHCKNKAYREKLSRKFSSACLIFEAMAGFPFSVSLPTSKLGVLRSTEIKLVGQLISWSTYLQQNQDEEEISLIKEALMDFEKRSCMQSRRDELKVLLDRL